MASRKRSAPNVLSGADMDTKPFTAALIRDGKRIRFERFATLHEATDQGRRWRAGGWLRSEIDVQGPDGSINVRI